MKTDKLIAYIDSSIILRHAVRDKAAFKDLEPYAAVAVTSTLTRVECFRVLDRFRLTREISETGIASAWQVVREFLASIKTVPINTAVVDLASQSFPIALKSLDAIHLASAILARNTAEARGIMITHDVKLALAAQAMDLDSAGA